MLFILLAIPILGSSQEKIGSWGEFTIKSFLLKGGFISPPADSSLKKFYVKSIGGVSNSGLFNSDIPYNLEVDAYKYGTQRGVLLTSMILSPEGASGHISHHFKIEEITAYYNFLKKKLLPEAVKVNYLAGIKSGLFVEVLDGSFGSHDEPKREYRIWIEIEGESYLRVHAISEKELNKLYTDLLEYIQ